MILFCVLNIVQNFCSKKLSVKQIWKEKRARTALDEVGGSIALCKVRLCLWLNWWKLGELSCHFFSSEWVRRKHCARRQSDAPARLPLPFLSIIVILHLLTIIRNYPARKKTIISPKSSQTNSTLQKVSLKYSTDQSQTTIVKQIGQVSVFGLGWGTWVGWYYAVT